MIDLHCHLLPGIDDGPLSLEVSLAMARIAVADGIRVTACTPHIYPGLYENEADGIRGAVAAAGAALDAGDTDAAAGHFIDFWMGEGAWQRTPESRRGPIAESVRNEYCLKITGKVRARPAGTVNALGSQAWPWMVTAISFWLVWRLLAASCEA